MVLEYVQLFADMEQLFAPYGDAERGRLMTAMLAYAFRGEEPHFDGNERFLWPVLKRHIDRCAENVETRRENGSKGGRPKKAETEQNLTKADETEKNLKKADESKKKLKNHNKEKEKEQEQEQEQEKEQEKEQEQRAHAREGATAPAPPAAPDHLRGSANVIPANRSASPNSSQQVANQSQFSRNSVASSSQVVAKNATTTTTLEEPVIAFDGTDLTADGERYDAVERLIKRYSLADNYPTLSALMEDADRYGLPAVEGALSRAAMSDRRGGISVNFYRRFLPGMQAASCAQASPSADPYGGGSGHSPPPDTSNPFLVLLQREEENAREQGGDP